MVAAYLEREIERDRDAIRASFWEWRCEGTRWGQNLPRTPTPGTAQGTRGPDRGGKTGYTRVEFASKGSISPTLRTTYGDPQTCR